MNNELRNQIYDSLNLKDTDELLGIWQTNDHLEWSDSAFDSIRKILTKRGIEIPEQDEPILEEIEEDVLQKRYNITEEEWRIINDERPPEFYDPFDVVIITKRIEFAAVASIVFVTLSALLQYQYAENLARSYLQNYPSMENLVLPMTWTSIALAMTLAVVTTYFPLKALAHILRILMEMEFNSRK